MALASRLRSAFRASATAGGHGGRKKPRGRDDHPFDAMTDPIRRREERRAEWRAGIILFLLGSAVFALAISYLARIAGLI